MKIVYAYCLLATLVPGPNLQAQTGCTPPAARSWMRTVNAVFDFDTLWFGFDSAATYGIDPQLCEYERPPLPPRSECDFMPVFTDVPGHPPTFGMGIIQDYRQYLNRTQVDTHRVYFGTRLSDCYPLRFEWSAQSIMAMCDSARLIDQYGGTFVNVKMNDVELAELANTSVSSLLICRYGAKQSVTDVGQLTGHTPEAFWLTQNYPNPFNPATTVSFSIPRSAFVSITISNTIGQAVTTLVSEEMPPGIYSTNWNARNAPSGVYFCTLRAGDLVSTKKVMLLR